LQVVDSACDRANEDGLQTIALTTWRPRHRIESFSVLSCQSEEKKIC